MSSIDLRLLRYFVAVAEEGHLTKAAQRLGIQQPPLSQQIRALEKELGVALFRRLPRGMELTESGHALLADAHLILEQVGTTIDSVRRIARGERGRIAIGFTETASLNPLIPAVIRAFRQSSPDVALAIEESNTAELVEALLRNRLDVAFIRSPVGNAAGLKMETMLVEEMIAALPATHPLLRGQGRRRKSLPLTALAKEDFILNRRPSGPGLYDTVIAACRAAGFSPRVVQEARKYLSTLSQVAAGLGVTIVPASMRHVQLEGVVYLQLEQAPGLRAPLHLAYRDAPQSGAVERMIVEARKFAAPEDG
ncbi:LysR family transcriptional regulator [Oxalicibacterium solurbis]|uniref:LysR family transcriptional regulator n=1 Tax=Oxalicibacterium solurbis TaxID=69280 RepID=A0A8J3F583_9BURK|nr:LysR family transcriptional regulator [Oxalicibacterium solurbis]GGI53296.1 LysR family transcriptional regulator [Oxalicibacterium solurbis]